MAYDDPSSISHFVSSEVCPEGFVGVGGKRKLEDPGLAQNLSSVAQHKRQGRSSHPQPAKITTPGASAADTYQVGTVEKSSKVRWVAESLDSKPEDRAIAIAQECAHFLQRNIIIENHPEANGGLFQVTAGNVKKNSTPIKIFYNQEKERYEGYDSDGKKTPLPLDGDGSKSIQGAIFVSSGLTGVPYEGLMAALFITRLANAFGVPIAVPVCDSPDYVYRPRRKSDKDPITNPITIVQESRDRFGGVFNGRIVSGKQEAMYDSITRAVVVAQRGDNPTVTKSDIEQLRLDTCRAIAQPWQQLWKSTVKVIHQVPNESTVSSTAAHTTTNDPTEATSPIDSASGSASAGRETTATSSASGTAAQTIPVVAQETDGEEGTNHRLSGKRGPGSLAEYKTSPEAPLSATKQLPGWVGECYKTLSQFNDDEGRPLVSSPEETFSLLEKLDRVDGCPLVPRDLVVPLQNFLRFLAQARDLGVVFGKAAFAHLHNADALWPDHPLSDVVIRSRIPEAKMLDDPEKQEALIRNEKIKALDELRHGVLAPLSRAWAPVGSRNTASNSKDYDDSALTSVRRLFEEEESDDTDKPTALPAPPPVINKERLAAASNVASPGAGGGATTSDTPAPSNGSVTSGNPLGQPPPVSEGSGNARDGGVRTPSSPGNMNASSSSLAAGGGASAGGGGATKRGASVPPGSPVTSDDPLSQTPVAGGNGGAEDGGVQTPSTSGVTGTSKTPTALPPKGLPDWVDIDHYYQVLSQSRDNKGNPLVNSLEEMSSLLEGLDWSNGRSSRPEDLKDRIINFHDFQHEALDLGVTVDNAAFPQLDNANEFWPGHPLGDDRIRSRIPGEKMLGDSEEQAAVIRDEKIKILDELRRGGLAQLIRGPGESRNTASNSKDYDDSALTSVRRLFEEEESDDTDKPTALPAPPPVINKERLAAASNVASPGAGGGATTSDTPAPSNGSVTSGNPLSQTPVAGGNSGAEDGGVQTPSTSGVTGTSKTPTALPPKGLPDWVDIDHYYQVLSQSRDNKGNPLVNSPEEVSSLLEGLDWSSASSLNLASLKHRLIHFRDFQYAVLDLDPDLVVDAAAFPRMDKARQLLFSHPLHDDRIRYRIFMAKMRGGSEEQEASIRDEKIKVLDELRHGELAQLIRVRGPGESSNTASDPEREEKSEDIEDPIIVPVQDNTNASSSSPAAGGGASAGGGGATTEGVTVPSNSSVTSGNPQRQTTVAGGNGSAENGGVQTPPISDIKTASNSEHGGSATKNTLSGSSLNNTEDSEGPSASDPESEGESEDRESPTVVPGRDNTRASSFSPAAGGGATKRSTSVSSNSSVTSDNSQSRTTDAGRKGRAVRTPSMSSVTGASTTPTALPPKGLPDWVDIDHYYQVLSQSRDNKGNPLVNSLEEMSSLLEGLDWSNGRSSRPEDLKDRIINFHDLQHEALDLGVTVDNAAFPQLDNANEFWPGHPLGDDRIRSRIPGEKMLGDSEEQAAVIRDEKIKILDELRRGGLAQLIRGPGESRNTASNSKDYDDSALTSVRRLFEEEESDDTDKPTALPAPPPVINKERLAAASNVASPGAGGGATTSDTPAPSNGSVTSGNPLGQTTVAGENGSAEGAEGAEGGGVQTPSMSGVTATSKTPTALPQNGLPDWVGTYYKVISPSNDDEGRPLVSSPEEIFSLLRELNRKIVSPEAARAALINFRRLQAYALKWGRGYVEFPDSMFVLLYEASCLIHNPLWHVKKAIPLNLRADGPGRERHIADEMFKALKDIYDRVIAQIKPNGLVGSRKEESDDTKDPTFVPSPGNMNASSSSLAAGGIASAGAGGATTGGASAPPASPVTSSDPLSQTPVAGGNGGAEDGGVQTPSTSGVTGTSKTPTALPPKGLPDWVDIDDYCRVLSDSRDDKGNPLVNSPEEVSSLLEGLDWSSASSLNFVSLKHRLENFRDFQYAVLDLDPDLVVDAAAFPRMVKAGQLLFSHPLHDDRIRRRVFMANMLVDSEEQEASIRDEKIKVLDELRHGELAQLIRVRGPGESSNTASDPEREEKSEDREDPTSVPVQDNTSASSSSPAAGGGASVGGGGATKSGTPVSSNSSVTSGGPPSQTTVAGGNSSAEDGGVQTQPISDIKTANNPDSGESEDIEDPISVPDQDSTNVSSSSPAAGGFASAGAGGATTGGATVPSNSSVTSSDPQSQTPVAGEYGSAEDGGVQTPLISDIKTADNSEHGGSATKNTVSESSLNNTEAPSASDPETGEKSDDTDKNPAFVPVSPPVINKGQSAAASNVASSGAGGATTGGANVPSNSSVTSGGPPSQTTVAGGNGGAEDGGVQTPSPGGRHANDNKKINPESSTTAASSSGIRRHKRAVFGTQTPPGSKPPAAPIRGGHISASRNQAARAAALSTHTRGGVRARGARKDIGVSPFLNRTTAAPNTRRRVAPLTDEAIERWLEENFPRLSTVKVKDGEESNPLVGSFAEAFTLLKGVTHLPEPRFSGSNSTLDYAGLVSALRFFRKLQADTRGLGVGDDLHFKDAAFAPLWNADELRYDHMENNVQAIPPHLRTDHLQTNDKEIPKRERERAEYIRRKRIRLVEYLQNTYVRKAG